MFSTGYFADRKHSTKVHVVYAGRAVCGVRVGKDMQYQFCSSGVNTDYLECELCQRRVESVEAPPRFKLQVNMAPSVATGGE